MSFDALIEELEELKSLKKSLTDEPEKEIDEQQEEDTADDAEELGKSFTMTDENGDEIEAVDGTELVKSLTAKLDKQEADFAEHNDGLMKAFETMKEVLMGQSEMIQSLTADVATLRSDGRGRKSVVSITEKPGPTMLKAEPESMGAEEFMTKAMTAQKEGRVNSMDISIAESALNKGVAVPIEIVRKVIIN